MHLRRVPRGMCSIQMDGRMDPHSTNDESMPLAFREVGGDFKWPNDINIRATLKLLDRYYKADPAAMELGCDGK